MFTLSEENYLKAIYHLETDSKKGISTNAIAKSLATKPMFSNNICCNKGIICNRYGQKII